MISKSHSQRPESFKFVDRKAARPKLDIDSTDSNIVLDCSFIKCEDLSQA